MKRLSLILMVLIVLSLSSCLKKPGIPTWYSTFNFPILHDTIRVMDIIDDSEHIIIGPDSLIIFNLTTDIDTMWPSESLTISDIDTTFRAGLGKLVVRDISSGGVTISWDNFPLPDSILDTIRNHQNDSILIYLPTIQPSTVTDTTDTLTKFAWAGINYASITVHFENNFPITISPYKIWIYSLNDVGDTNLIFHGEIDSITPYDLIDTTLTISHVYTTNVIRLIEYMGVPGGDSVYVSWSNNFFVNVTIDSIVVDSARAFFPGFSVNDTFNMSLNFDQGTIDTVRLHSGDISLNIYNPLPIEMLVNFRSNNLLYLNGTPFDTTFHILPDTTSEFHINLAWKTVAAGDSGINFIVSTDIDSQWIEVRDYDSVGVEASITNVLIDYVSGVFDSLETDIPEIDTFIDFPDSPRIYLVHVFLTGNIVQTLNFSPLVTLWFVNVNDTNTITDTVRFYLNRGSHDTPTETPLNLDLSWVFARVPREIRIGGKVMVNGRGSTYRDDYVTGHVNLTVPFTVILLADTMVSDTFIDSVQVDTAIIDRYESGVLSIRLRNRISTGFNGKLTVTSNVGDTMIKYFRIPPAPHDVNGFATSEMDTTLTFNISHDEAVIFTADEQKSWVDVYIPYTDTVSIRASDYIKIDVYGELKAKMGE